MTKVIIDRAKWDRGEGSEGELLVDNARGKDGCRCALGFVALACGIPDDEVSGYSFPEKGNWPETIARDVYHEDGTECDRGVLTPVGQCIVSVNDDRSIADYVREAELTHLFAAAGLELEFVGEGKP